MLTVELYSPSLLIRAERFLLLASESVSKEPSATSADKESTIDVDNLMKCGLVEEFFSSNCSDLNLPELEPAK